MRHFPLFFTFVVILFMTVATAHFGLNIIGRLNHTDSSQSVNVFYALLTEGAIWIALAGACWIFLTRWRPGNIWQTMMDAQRMARLAAVLLAAGVIAGIVSLFTGSFRWPILLLIAIAAGLRWGFESVARKVAA